MVMLTRMLLVSSWSLWEPQEEEEDYMQYELLLYCQILIRIIVCLENRYIAGILLDHAWRTDPANNK